MSHDEMKLKAITIDMSSQESEPERKIITQRGKNKYLSGEKRGKILKVEILRGVFIGYKDILPRIDLARSERSASLY
jgi:hypothetical protein